MAVGDQICRSPTLPAATGTGLFVGRSSHRVSVAFVQGWDLTSLKQNVQIKTFILCIILHYAAVGQPPLYPLENASRVLKLSILL